MALNNERRRWRNQRNGLPQGSVLSPILFNIYTNDQPHHSETRNFIYADDLCVTAQHPSFKQTEDMIEDVLGEITQYYRNNSLRANPDKTQVTSFHLRNKDAKRELDVTWNGTELENTAHSKYLCVKLDRTRSYKKHIHNTKMKVATRNNLLKKLSTSKWGGQMQVQSKSRPWHSVTRWWNMPAQHGKNQLNIDPELNKACRERHHWMSQSVQGRTPVHASWNCTAGHSKKSMC